MSISTVEVSVTHIDSFLHTADIDHNSKLVAVSHKIPLDPITLTQVTPRRPAPTGEQGEGISLLALRVKHTSLVQHAPPEKPSGPKPHLVIHKMVLINLKTYAGGQEVGPFHQSFSSIVNPNGSGKSNTIWALLFVFGCCASSRMRQGKLSELIHNPVRYLDLHECCGEVRLRAIINLLLPMRRVSRRPKLLRIVETQKAKLDAERKEVLAWLKLKNERARALASQPTVAALSVEGAWGITSSLARKLERACKRERKHITHLAMLEEHYKEREWPYEELKAAAEEATTDQSARKKQSVGLQEG
ncbi:hypothetical protein AZE42_09779 [Rhizopogon vesiculosus]|uniref:RecF/RecN/SMC N-terminal domain-containing protein n=1 Tax=Rhizopogon vesiculosus TaxID=180088 RepID=A0A1J8Q819_9AGAM|nr:hypothetical protein AZE42_09779 [Rhizopogon vesiculosus]